MSIIIFIGADNDKRYSNKYPDDALYFGIFCPGCACPGCGT